MNNSTAPVPAPAPAAFAVPVGNGFRPSVAVASVRTPGQAARVAALVASPEFSFACSNPLELEFEGETYRCTFTFTWYDRSGGIHFDRISPTGRVTRSVTYPR